MPTVAALPRAVSLLLFIGSFLHSPYSYCTLCTMRLPWRRFWVIR